MVNQDIRLTDLVGAGSVQYLQDHVADITGIMTVLVDADANMLTKPSRASALIDKIITDADGAEWWSGIIKSLCVKNRSVRDIVVTNNQRKGIVIGAVPLFLGEAHLGSWIIGPFPTKFLGREDLYRVVLMTGVSDTVAREAAGSAGDMAFFRKEQQQRILRFYKSLTQTVMELAQVNYDMIQTNRSLVELTEKLDSTAQMLSKFTNSADVGMYVTDYFTGEILQANDHYARYLGLPLDKVIGASCLEVGDDCEEAFAIGGFRDKLLDDKGFPSGPVFWERYIPRLDMWAQFINQAIYWVDGRLAQMVTFSDITKLKKMQQQLTRLAYYDRVMKLPNSLKLLSDLQTWSARDWYYIFCFDIVSLRLINDVYSRQTGDRLLAVICDWVKTLVARDDCVYRIDGDEFAVLLKNMERDDALKIAGQITERFDKPWIFAVDGASVHIFCNIYAGVIYLESPPETEGEDLLNLIERTMAAARKGGRLAVYDEKMDQEYKKRLILGHSLRTCIKEGMRGFEVYYQPIVNAKTRRWSSLEALCRWTSPECGAVSPIIFIHEAEQMGLIGDLGHWVLEQSIRQCKEWQLDRLDDFILDVNLSPAQMTDESLVGAVMQILKRYDYPGEKLSLEITESTELNFSNHTLNAIERLRSANIIMALDDFGTGYSSFNNLKRLPVGILKTEHAFLKGIENDSYLQYLLYMMVKLSHVADMRLVTEGVENERQLRILMKNGVDFMQGYLFSEPLPPHKLSEMLDNFTKPSPLFKTALDGSALDHFNKNQ